MTVGLIATFVFREFRKRRTLYGPGLADVGTTRVTDPSGLPVVKRHATYVRSGFASGNSPIQSAGLGTGIPDQVTVISPPALTEVGATMIRALGAAAVA